MSNNKINLLQGLGYVGIGKYQHTINKVRTKEYTIWNQMFQRCYNNKYPTYSNIYVDERWYDFQNFAEWWEKNYITGFHLDKDILIKGNKVYGPDTCCFVPAQINNLFCLSNKIRGELPIGVVFDKRRNKYIAQLKKYGKSVNLGRYNSINEAFLSYKNNKELYICELANHFKNQLTNKVYEALINYKIEITD